MGVSAVSPPAFTDRPLAIYWPLPVATAAVAAAFNRNGYTQGGQSVSLWNAPTGAGTVNHLVYKDQFCAQVSSTAVNQSQVTTGVPAFIGLTKNSVAATFQPPGEYTIFRWRFLFAQRTAANYTSLSGIALVPYAGTAPAFPSAGNPGFGIFGDGAGGFQFMSSKGAGFIAAATTALTWPQAVTEWTTVDFEVLGATGASDAAFNLYLNGVLVALPASVQKWGAGTNLVDYSVTANSCGFGIVIQAADALVGQLVLGAYSQLFGRYRAQSGSQVGTLL